jgi:hypothetical protein
MRFWDDKDGTGTKLTDGRVCLVIQNPDMPEIRTYGKDKDEVLEKLANTTETAQLQIHRMRKNPAAPAAPARQPVAATPSTDVARAVTELSDPTKAGAALRTILKSEGIDLDRQARLDTARRIADVAEQWEREHPDYPKDPRNDQILMNKAALVAGGALRITAEHIDAAYEQLVRAEMFFEPKAAVEATVQHRGSDDSRTVRSATSYRRNNLRSSEPAPAVRGDTAQEAKWRAILETGSGEAQERAIRTDPGYVEWVSRVTAKKTA